MDEKRTDLRAALRALAAEESGDAGPHVGSKRLIAYRQGTLPAAERDAVQEHLSRCPRCTGLWRELKELETAAARGDAGPEPQRRAAWESLAGRLAPQAPQAPQAPAVRPAPPRRLPLLAYSAAAVLLLALAGLAVWATLTAQQDRQRLARLERRLEEREAALTATRRSLADAERRLDAAREAGGRVDELTARVAALTSELEELRRTGRAPEAPDRIAAAPRAIDLSVSPRFSLRGQAEGGLLQGDGALNPVSISTPADRFTVALRLADHPAYGEYRLELVDQNGKVLWSGRRPGKSLLGDAGTSVSLRGLGPGLYRLRIAGLPPGRRELLGEYLLEVAAR